MAREVIERLIDDIDGGDADETVRFGLDGKDYEIDLNTKNAAALRKALDKFVGVARRADSTRMPRKRASSGAAASGVDPAAVRVWAAENNIELSPRGRVPANIVEQYKAAVGR